MHFTPDNHANLDFLAEAANRCLRGDSAGASWVWHHVMSDAQRLDFDFFLVRMADELAFQPGTPESRFKERVRRMVTLECQRRNIEPAVVA